MTKHGHGLPRKRPGRSANEEIEADLPELEPLEDLPVLESMDDLPELEAIDEVDEGPVKATCAACAVCPLRRSCAEGMCGYLMAFRISSLIPVAVAQYM